MFSDDSSKTSGFDFRSNALRVNNKNKHKRKKKNQDFPGGPMAQFLCSQCRGPSSIPGLGTRSCMLQLRGHMLELKILLATVKTWHSQIN